MLKCPFCHFENEDGALFCEQCKSDLAGVEPTAPPAGPADLPVPAGPADVLAGIPETIALVPLAEGPAVIEALPVEPTLTETIPVAAVAPMPYATDLPAAAPLSPSGSFLPPTSEYPAPDAVVPGVSATSSPPVLPETADYPVPPSTAPAAGPGGAAPPASVAVPRLVVLRGLKRNIEYPIYEGPNFIGRADEKPVDIDLDDQESPDRVWVSRQHAVLTLEGGSMILEDLNSSNGTFVNRARIYPGTRRDLAVGDVIQIGTVQMKVVL